MAETQTGPAVQRLVIDREALAKACYALRIRPEAITAYLSYQGTETLGDSDFAWDLPGDHRMATPEWAKGEARRAADMLLATAEADDVV